MEHFSLFRAVIREIFTLEEPKMIGMEDMALLIACLESSVCGDPGEADLRL